MKTITLLLFSIYLFCYSATHAQQGISSQQDANSKFQFISEFCSDQAMNRDYLLDHANIVGSQKEEILQFVPKFRQQVQELSEKYKRQFESLAATETDHQKLAKRMTTLRKQAYHEQLNLVNQACEQVDELFVAGQYQLLSSILRQRRVQRNARVACFEWFVYFPDASMDSMQKPPQAFEAIQSDFQTKAKELRKEVFKQITDGWSEKLKVEVAKSVGLQDKIFALQQSRPRVLGTPEPTPNTIAKWTEDDFDKFEVTEQLAIINQATADSHVHELLKISELQLDMLKELQGQAETPSGANEQSELQKLKNKLDEFYSNVFDTDQEQLIRLAGNFSRNRFEKMTGDEFALLLVAIDNTSLDATQRNKLTNKILDLRIKYLEELHQLRRQTAKKVLETLPGDNSKKFDSEYAGQVYDYQDEVAHSWTEARNKKFPTNDAPEKSRSDGMH